MTFEMRFDSVDYNELIDDQDARAVFEAEYVAVVRRGARRAFEDTVSSVLAEDQGIVDSPIRMCFSGHLFAVCQVCGH